MKLKNGNLVLFKRQHSPNWYARIKTDKGWYQFSTKIEDDEKAKKVSLDKYDEVRYKINNSIPVKSGTMGQLLNEILNDGCKNIIQLKHKNKNYNRTEKIIRRYILPFFKDKRIDSINEIVIKNWYKSQNTINGSKLAASTLAYHNIVLRSIFDYAKQKKLINENQIPKLSLRGQGSKQKIRSEFSEREIDKLLTYFNTLDYSNMTTNKANRLKLLKSYVMFLLYTGMRPGNEALNIRWCDIEPASKGIDEIRYYKIKVTKGKIGPRTVISMMQVEDVMNQLQKDGMINTKFNKNDYIFRLPNKQDNIPEFTRPLFKKVLNHLNLLNDNNNVPRTLYSLRHTYATRKLLENKVSIVTLAQNMGTSVKMIEKHYAGILNVQKAEDLV